jgi:hypothetical protein
MDQIITCQTCGGHSPHDAAFCIECGAALAPAATGPTVRLERPADVVGERRPASVSQRTAEPPPFVPLRPLPPRPMPSYAPPAPRQARPAQTGGGLGMPIGIIMVALMLLFVPRFGGMAVMAIGAGGLALRGMLTRPDRVLPLLVLLGFIALLVTGSKLFWPALVGVLVLRAMLGRHGWRP